MMQDIAKADEFPVGTGIYRGMETINEVRKRVPCRYRDIPS